jgi:ABC-type multidrug transport system permease subunit
VYGERNPRYIDFLAPGIIIMTSFAHSIGLTAVAFVNERSDFTMDRVLASGARASEILLGRPCADTEEKKLVLMEGLTVQATC